MNFLADFVSPLQLVKQIGHCQLIVWVLDFVEGRVFGFLAFAGINLHSVLLLVFLGALQHAFANVFLGLRGFLALVAAATLGRIDLILIFFAE